MRPWLGVCLQQRRSSAEAVDISWCQQQQLAAGQAELARRLAAEEARLTAERAGELARAQVAAEAETAALLGEARRYAARLAALDDTTLCTVLRRHLPRLLPGRSDDCPDGQG